MLRYRVLATLSAALLTVGAVAVPADAAAAPMPTPPQSAAAVRLAAIHNTTFGPGSMMVDPDGKLVPVGQPDKISAGATASTVRPKPQRPTAGPVTKFSACSTFCYSYAAAYATFAAGNLKEGARVEAHIEKPAMDSTDWSGGAHTLGELAVIDSATNSYVEIGYRIANDQGDGWTHLFLSAWKNGTWLGYNATGGFADNGAVSVNAGDNINTQVGTSQRLVAQRVQSGGASTPGWWMGYGTPSQWIGIYPDSTIWLAGTSTPFTNANEVDAYDEIASKHFPTCTDMGKGVLGSASGSYPTSGSEMASFATEATAGGAYSATNFTGVSNTDATKWKAILKTADSTTAREGGPGYSPDPSACP